MMYISLTDSEAQELIPVIAKAATKLARKAKVNLILGETQKCTNYALKSMHLSKIHDRILNTKNLAEVTK